MRKFDQYLLTHFPLVWQSRIHYVVPFWLIYASLCAIAGFLTVDPVERADLRLWNGLHYLFFSFASVIFTILYLIFYTRHNYFKWYGISRPLSGLTEYLLSFASVWMLSSGMSVFSFCKELGNFTGNHQIALESLQMAYYVSLIFSALLFIYRRVKPRNFIIGFVILNIFLLLVFIFLGVSSSSKKVIDAVFVMLPLIAAFVAYPVASASKNFILSSLAIFYHGFLPFAGLLVYGILGMDYEVYWLKEYNPYLAFLITILLVMGITTPSAKAQWGREG